MVRFHPTGLYGGISKGETTCSVCGRLYVYSRKQGHRRQVCNSCGVNHRRYQKRQKLIEYKGGTCQICGYHRCSDALDFHHTDPQEKDFTISGNHCKTLESLKKEVDKCILLCANCHREVHSKLIKLSPQ